MRPRVAEDVRLPAAGVDDRGGIERAVLSISGPGVQIERDTATAIRRARESNDFLANEIRKRPDRYAGFAHLALQDGKAAAEWGLVNEAVPLAKLRERVKQRKGRGVHAMWRVAVEKEAAALTAAKQLRDGSRVGRRARCQGARARCAPGRPGA